VEYLFTAGTGRTRVSLQASNAGLDLVVRIYNKNAHIGAVAVGEYDLEHQRASVSVITRLGHKDDIIARKAAYEISRNTQKTVCTIVGIHLTDITEEEIDLFILNTGSLVDKLLNVLINNINLKES
jgi:hypothetical protein